MEKDAILNIVINDIKELDLLMSTFKGKASIPQAYFRLIHSKLNNISEEMAMLEELHKTPSPTNGNSTQSMPVAKQEPAKETEKAPQEQHRVTEEITETLSFIDDEPDTTAMDVQPTTQEMAPPTAQAQPATDMKNAIKHEIVVPPVDTMEKREAVATTATMEKQPIMVIETVPEAPKPMKPKGEHSVLGETIGMDRKSLNETITNQFSADDLTKIGTPVDDIRKAMGINDRFYFQRELFDNNNTIFNDTLDQINTMGSFNQAYIYLKSTYNWDESLKETEEFLRAVRRRFL